MDLRGYVEHILAWQFDAVAIRPACQLAELSSLAERAHYYAAVDDPFPDPRVLAVALGFELIPRAPRGLCGEGTALGRIAFRADPNRQTQGLRVLHGLAHAILHEERETNTDADAWVLTGLLAVPLRFVSLALSEPERATTHVPSWFVDAAIGATERESQCG